MKISELKANKSGYALYFPFEAFDENLFKSILPGASLTGPWLSQVREANLN